VRALRLLPLAFLSLLFSFLDASVHGTPALTCRDVLHQLRVGEYQAARYLSMFEALKEVGARLPRAGEFAFEVRNLNNRGTQPTVTVAEVKDGRRQRKGITDKNGNLWLPGEGETWDIIPRNAEDQGWNTRSRARVQVRNEGGKWNLFDKDGNRLHSEKQARELGLPFRTDGDLTKVGFHAPQSIPGPFENIFRILRGGEGERLLDAAGNVWTKSKRATPAGTNEWEVTSKRGNLYYVFEDGGVQKITQRNEEVIEKISRFVSGIDEVAPKNQSYKGQTSSGKLLLSLKILAYVLKNGPTPEYQALGIPMSESSNISNPEEKLTISSALAQATADWNSLSKQIYVEQPELLESPTPFLVFVRKNLLYLNSAQKKFCSSGSC